MRIEREAKKRRVAEGYRESLVYVISMLENIGRVEQPKRKVDDLARCCTFPCKLHVVRAPTPYSRLVHAELEQITIYDTLESMHKSCAYWEVFSIERSIVSWP
jgi:hypothetical protein